MAARCGITEEEAQEVIDDFFKQFPGLHKWQIDQGDRALLERNTETPYGRKRFYEIIRHKGDEEYEKERSQIRRWVGNHPIQAASADMLKDATRRIVGCIRGADVDGPDKEAPDRYDKLNEPVLYDAHIIMVVHDEIVIECWEDHVEPVKLIMEKCMGRAYENIIGDVIPNKIDVAVESSWEKA